MRWNSRVDINVLIGKTFTKVCEDDDGLTFSNDEEAYSFYHDQDCCESVSLEDIVGDLSDLEGTPILGAEEVYYDGEPQSKYDESYTWTFYKFRTIKGYVDVRWYGTSNGYYSESVDLHKVK